MVKSQRDQTIDHVENFLDCVRSAETPERGCLDRTPFGAGVAPVQHRLRQKRRIHFDPDREEILPGS